MQDYSSHVLKSRGVVRFHLSALVLAVTALVSPALAIAADTPVACTVSCTGVSGVVNDYWPATQSSANNGTTIGGTTGVGRIVLGTRRPGGASTSPIAAGDWLLIIQMQDVGINIPPPKGSGYSYPGIDDSKYGDGTGSGVGYTMPSTTPPPAAGLYEFARADSLSGSAVILTKPLINQYVTRAQNTTTTRASYQVIRLPYCRDMTLGTNITGLPWDGNTGGVIALFSKNITLGGALIDASKLGFRGGATDAHNSNYPTSNYASVIPEDQYKGEGIVGTPNYIYDTVSGEISNTGGTNTPLPFPGGYRGKGAPGNAGGGGAGDAGGGGGGNGGAGGTGGWWASGSDGGLGGGVFTQRAFNRVVMGGGGGGGSSGTTSANESTIPYGVGSNGYARGGAGGGIVLLGATTRTGSLSVKADGADATAYSTSKLSNSGVASGGGAGGSIIIFGSGGTISAQALGGAGSDFTQHAGAEGGGGGGGIAGGVTTAVLSGGRAGITGPATDGAPGPAQLSVGTPPGNASCPLASNLSITKTNTPGVNNNVDQASDTVISGQKTTYTIIVTNNTGADDIGAGTYVLDSAATAGLTCPEPGSLNVTCANITGVTGCATAANTYGPSSSTYYTAAALKTSPGIQLGPLKAGDSVQLTLVCKVN